MKQRHSELAVDLYRGIAALLVLLAHAITLTLRSFHGVDITTYPLAERLLSATLGLGTFWVWGFFVISGFCIHQSVQRDCERGSFDLRRYALARVTRIYPLFLIGLVLAVASWWLTGGDDHPGSPFPLNSMLATLVFAQQFTGDFPGFDPAWSLGNEMLYYALWPLALSLFQWRSLRAAMGAAFASVAVTAIVVIVWKTQFKGDSTHWLIPVWGLSSLFVLWLVGAALATLWNQIKDKVSPRLAIAAIAWLVAVYAVQAAVHFVNGRAFGYMLAAYASAPGFALLMAGGHWLRLGDSAMWTTRAAWLGTLSYPCYILHMPVLHLIEYGIVPHLPNAIRTQPVLHLAMLVPPTVLIVSTIGVALEQGIMRWRSRVLKKLPASTPSNTSLTPARVTHV